MPMGGPFEDPLQVSTIQLAMLQLTRCTDKGQLVSVGHGGVEPVSYCVALCVLLRAKTASWTQWRELKCRLD